MSLYEAMMDNCIKVIPRRVPDGEGGHATTYEEAETFKAAIIRDTSRSERKAEKDSLDTSVTVTTMKDVVLKYDDIIKNLRTGKTYKILSDSTDVESPEMATFELRQAEAKRWTP